MADESTRRSYQSNGPYQGGEASGASRRSSDPLAELARLIGQSDPYTDLGQNVPRRTDTSQSKSPSASMDWRQAAAAMPPYENLQSDAQEPPIPPRHGSHYADFERARDPYSAATDSPYSGRPADDHAYERPYPSQAGHYQADRDDRMFADGSHNSDGYAGGDRYDD